MQSLPKLIASRLPGRPYCTDNLQYGLVICPPEISLEKSYLQLNPPILWHWMVFNIDEPMAAQAWGKSQSHIAQLDCRESSEYGCASRPSAGNARHFSRPGLTSAGRSHAAFAGAGEALGADEDFPPNVLLPKEVRSAAPGDCSDEGIVGGHEGSRHEFQNVGKEGESSRLHSSTYTGTGSKRGAWLAVPITRAVRSAPETPSYLAGIFSLSLNSRWLAGRGR